MKKSLPPIVCHPEYSGPVDRELYLFLDEVLYLPLRLDLSMRLNADPKKRNSALWDAILAGAIWYANDVFSGQFSAEISRELRFLGARRVGENFYLKRSELPIAMRGVVVLAAQRSTELHGTIRETLNRIATNLPRATTGIRLQKQVDKVVNDLQTQLVRSVSSVAGPSAVTPVPAELTDRLRETMTRDLDRAIKDFLFERIETLQSRLAQNLSEGGRVDLLAKIIEAEFGMGQRKTRLLADQAMSELVSQFRESRYRSLGYTEYVWETSHDEKVRPTHGETNNHRVLDGRTFSWDHPPVVDSATGRRCHPGQDYGPCRCAPRPLIRVS